MRTPAFWSATGRGDPRSVALAPLGWAYKAATALRVAKTGRRIPGLQVVCVGNLVAGGAGKTPTALALAEALRARGRAVGFLSKGYGGRLTGPVAVDPARHRAADVGDEPLLLAAAAPTWVARDRWVGALAARAAGVETLLLDDGFQDPTLAKDLSICVVDGGFGFGNRRGVPAGPMRESVAGGLRRADAMIVVGADAAEAAYEAKRLSIPTINASLRPAPPDAARGARLLAFAGVGRPEKVFESWRAAGLDLADAVGFPDHHPYTAADWADLRSRAAALNATPATTTKDAARLPALARPPLVVPAALIWDAPAAVDRLLSVLD